MYKVVYEIAFNFSYFSDDNLTEKRKKGRKYLNLLNSNESSIPADSIYKSYYEYANIYSNTPNFKGSLSVTYYNSIIKNLTTTVTIKGTSPYDFESMVGLQPQRMGKARCPKLVNPGE